MAKIVTGLLCVLAIGAAQTERWVYRYDGPGNSIDLANSLVCGADGNVYAAGRSVGSGTDVDLTVISLTADGDERWIYRYNGPGNFWDEAYSVVYGADGNLYVAGRSAVGSDNMDFIVTSLTSDGRERWIYRYNGPGNDYDEANSLVCGADGNIYVAGYGYGGGTNYDFTVISLTSDGNERWQYRYDGPGSWEDKAFSIVYGSDGNIYAAGRSDGKSGLTSWDFTVISLDSSGRERWVYRYNGPGDGLDQAYSLVYGSDDDIYAVGRSEGSGTGSDFTVVSLTSAGTERWLYRYNGPGDSADCGHSLIYGADGHICAVGWGAGIGTSYDFTVISLDSGGGERWLYRYDGPGNRYDLGYSLVCGADGSIYAAGYGVGIGTSYDFTIISLTPEGSERWIYRYDGPGNAWDYAYSLVYGSDGNIYAAGSSAGIDTSLDFTVISLNPAVGIEERNLAKLDGAKVVPSMAVRGTAFAVTGRAQDAKVTILDASGRVVAMPTSGVWHTATVAPGAYFVRIRSRTQTVVRTVLVVE